MIHKVVVPRQVLKQRMPQERHEVALAPVRSQLLSEVQQVGQRVFEEVGVV